MSWYTYPPGDSTGTCNEAVDVRWTHFHPQLAIQQTPQAFSMQAFSAQTQVRTYVVYISKL